MTRLSRAATRTSPRAETPYPRRRAAARAAAWILCASLAARVSAVAAIESIQVVGLFENRAVVMIDGKQRVLRPGRASPEGVKLISADSEAAILEIDGHRRTFRLGRRITTVFRPAAEGQRVQIWPNRSGMYRIVGSINGYPVNFLVDTGATLIAMSRREAKRLGIDYLVEGSPGRSHTAAGSVQTYQVRLKRVRVGDIVLRNVAASVVDGDFPREVLLGNSFLNQLDLQRNGRMLELRQR